MYLFIIISSGGGSLKHGIEIGKKRVFKFLSGLVMTAQIFQSFLKFSSGLVVKFPCCLVMTAKIGQSFLKFPSGLVAGSSWKHRWSMAATVAASLWSNYTPSKESYTQCTMLQMTFLLDKLYPSMPNTPPLSPPPPP